jgi:hypothetical protein
MPRGVRLHPDVARELRALAASDMSFADLSRCANGAAERARAVRPSYDTVRRLTLDERRRRRRSRALDVLAGVLAGASAMVLAVEIVRRSC